MTPIRAVLSAARPIRAGLPGSRAPSAAYQPLDAELSALAALTSAANQLAYFTGLGTAALTSLTAYGRSLIGAADAPAAKVLLSLGLLASSVSGQTATLTGALTAPRSYTLPDATGTLAMLGQAQTWTALQTFSSGLTSGNVQVLPVSGYNCISLNGAGNLTTAVAIYSLSSDQALYLNAPTSQTVRLRVNGVDNLVVSGAVPGTPSGQVLIGAGVIKASAGITCTTLDSTTRMKCAIAGNAYISAASLSGIDCTLALSDDAGKARGIGFLTGANRRWIWYCLNDAESGGNAGSSMQLWAYDDANSAIDQPITIARAAGGSMTIARPISCQSLKLASADYIYLRGDASTDGSVRISSQSAGTAKLEARSGGTWSNISFT
jgi:hypothetical protein